jgi:hypothetical protein
MVNLVNATYEAEPVHGKQIVAQCKCINCGNHIEVQRPELRENPR